MKTLLISILALMTFVIPALAQVDHDFNPNDQVALAKATILKDQIPATVLKAVGTQFDKNNPLTWSKFPYALKEYGWVYDVGASNIQLDRYLVSMKTQEGSDYEAVYNASGELIESREMSLNIAIPKEIQDKLYNSKYKDWKVVGNKEIIKFYHDHNNNSVEQHLRLTVEKDKVTRSISFNFQGSN